MLHTDDAHAAHGLVGLSGGRVIVEPDASEGLCAWSNEGPPAAEPTRSSPRVLGRQTHWRTWANATANVNKRDGEHEQAQQGNASEREGGTRASVKVERERA
jgi:hypothetical protein